MLLMMIIRSDEDKSKGMAAEPGVPIPIKQIFF